MTVRAFIGALVLVLWGSVSFVHAQVVHAQDREQEALRRDLGAYRDTINTFQPQPFVLRPFMLAGSEQIILEGTRLDTTQYRIDYRHGRLWINTPHLDPDAELVAIYRTYPFRFKPVYRRRIADSAATSSEGSVAVVKEEGDEAADEGFNPFGGLKLERSGSITRGVIGGSNRDVNVESGLRMQLSGAITENVNVQAALTDENTPIQPEGTTQRLSDFDRVFVELGAPQGTARLGDVQVDFEGSEFGRFSRKLQGAAVSTADFGATVPGLTHGQVTAVGATTRGIYRTQDLEPIDGVQGPYRLEGKEGERFIVVIAGSERVYLDGQRMTRGETNDYVIDYAQAEITFTSNRLITEDRRITVEFEYRTSTFNRTLVGTEAQVSLWGRDGGQSSRVQVGASFLREADSRTFGDIFDLSPEDSLLLARSGDESVVRSGAERVEFNPEAPYVQYRRETRDGSGGTEDPIFVALDEAPADSTPVYRVRFTHVGKGRGSYERVGRSVNGILYEYRGVGEGAYDPVRRLPQPVQQRLFDLNGQFEPLPGVQVFGEWARSMNDQNRLSDVDASDDYDQAYRAGVRLQPTPVEVGAQSLGAVSGEYRRHQRGAHFATFNRTRPVEFGRRWNLAKRGLDPAHNFSGGETIDEAEVQYALTPHSKIRGEWGRLMLGDIFDGQRRIIDFATGEEGWPHLDYRLEYVTSDDRRNQLDGRWIRQRGMLQQNVLDGRLQPRFEIEYERRRQHVVGTDSLARASFAFVEYRPGIAYRAGSFEAGAELEYRAERDWAAGNLRDAATAWTAQTDLKYNPSSSFDSKARVGYRIRHFTDYFRINERREDTESVIIQLKSNAKPLNQAVEVQGFYDALTERTPTQQEIYVRTGPELGQYVWTDVNGDSLVQVDEFVPETTPNEGEYVQRFVPSDSLIPVINVQARLRAHLRPARLWRSADARWKRWLAQASTRTTLEVREKSRASDLAPIYLLNLSHFRQPETTVDGQLRVEQDLYLFRSTARYGLDLSFSQVRGLSERSAGQQTRFLNTWDVKGQYRPAPKWGLELAARWGTDRLDSEAFEDARHFDIDQVEVHPTISYRPSQSVRLSSGLAYSQKTDSVGGRTARLLKLPLDVRYSEAGRFQMTGHGEVANIDLDGQAVGLAQFELTDGRGPGTSFLWRVSGQYRINDYLRANLSYDGRAPARAPVIHTFRVQLSAQF